MTLTPSSSEANRRYCTAHIQVHVYNIIYQNLLLGNHLPPPSPSPPTRRLRLMRSSRNLARASFASSRWILLPTPVSTSLKGRTSEKRRRWVCREQRERKRDRHFIGKLVVVCINYNSEMQTVPADWFNHPPVSGCRLHQLDRAS